MELSNQPQTPWHEIAISLLILLGLAVVAFVGGAYLSDLMFYLTSK